MHMWIYGPRHGLFPTGKPAARELTWATGPSRFLDVGEEEGYREQSRS